MNKVRWAIVALLALGFVSCSMNYTEDYQVVNNSSYSVSMTNIVNADRTELLDIAPGARQTLTYTFSYVENNSISFSYVPANFVSAEINKDTNEIIFTDR